MSGSRVYSAGTSAAPGAKQANAVCSRLCASYVQLWSPGCAILSIISGYLYQLMSSASKVTRTSLALPP